MASGVSGPISWPSMPSSNVSPSSKKEIGLHQIISLVRSKEKEAKFNPILQGELTGLRTLLEDIERDIRWQEFPAIRIVLRELQNEVNAIDLRSPDASGQVGESCNHVQQFYTLLKSQKAFRRIASGALKDVWMPLEERPNYVIYGPRTRPGLLEKIRVIFRKRELRGELNTALKIKESIKENSRANLALEFSQEPEELIGDTAFKTELAPSDLEKTIRQKPCFPKSLVLCCQFLRGISALHGADWVHGDLKPENALVFTKGTAGQPAVKIADFGKAGRLNKDGKAIYSGNPRFAPPEWTLSQKGEVYSEGIVLIRTLEEEFLDEGDLVPLHENQLKDRSVEAKSRRGIEKFLVQNKNCPQREVKGLWNVVKRGIRVLGRRLVKPPQTDLNAAERDVHDYIVTLVGKLMRKYPELPTEKFREIGVLLCQMTLSDPAKRPDAEEAATRLDSILSYIQAQ